MSRWPPDAGARLKASALSLFAERGFANVRAAEIAVRAGMTERTFFRHFKAKEDVLFEEDPGLAAALTQTITNAPGDTPTWGLMRKVAECLGEQFDAERDLHLILAKVVANEPWLRARALLRDEEIGRTVAEGLVKRGFTVHRAILVAAIARSIFRLSYDEWLSEACQATLIDIFNRTAAGLSKAFAD